MATTPLQLAGATAVSRSTLARPKLGLHLTSPVSRRTPTSFAGELPVLSSPSDYSQSDTQGSPASSDDDSLGDAIPSAHSPTSRWANSTSTETAPRRLSYQPLVRSSNARPQQPSSRRKDSRTGGKSNYLRRASSPATSSSPFVGTQCSPHEGLHLPKSIISTQGDLDDGYGWASLFASDDNESSAVATGAASGQGELDGRSISFSPDTSFLQKATLESEFALPPLGPTYRPSMAATGLGVLRSASYGTRRLSAESSGERERVQRLGGMAGLNRRESEVLEVVAQTITGPNAESKMWYEADSDVWGQVRLLPRSSSSLLVTLTKWVLSQQSAWSPSTVASSPSSESFSEEESSGESSCQTEAGGEAADLQMHHRNISLTFSFEEKANATTGEELGLPADFFAESPSSTTLPSTSMTSFRTSSQRFARSSFSLLSRPALGPSLSRAFATADSDDEGEGKIASSAVATTASMDIEDDNDDDDDDAPVQIATLKRVSIQQALAYPCFPSPQRAPAGHGATPNSPDLNNLLSNYHRCSAALETDSELHQLGRRPSLAHAKSMPVLVSQLRPQTATVHTSVRPASAAEVMSATGPRRFDRLAAFLSTSSTPTTSAGPSRNASPAPGPALAPAFEQRQQSAAVPSAMRRMVSSSQPPQAPYTRRISLHSGNGASTLPVVAWGAREGRKVSVVSMTGRLASDVAAASRPNSQKSTLSSANGSTGPALCLRHPSPSRETKLLPALPPLPERKKSQRRDSQHQSSFGGNTIQRQSSSASRKIKSRTRRVPAFPSLPFERTFVSRAHAELATSAPARDGVPPPRRSPSRTYVRNSILLADTSAATTFPRRKVGFVSGDVAAASPRSPATTQQANKSVGRGKRALSWFSFAAGAAVGPSLPSKRAD